MKSRSIPRDKAAEVIRRTKEAIATQRNEDKKQRNVAEVTEEEISDAVNANVALVMSHRNDIGKLVEVENKLLEELNGDPTKLYIAQFQGQIIEKVVGLTVTEKSSALLNIASVQAKRIDKQRQAFGITDKSEGQGEITLSGIPADIAEMIGMKCKE
jgi:DNA-directed RNA polymerase specialized sigma subunit